MSPYGLNHSHHYLIPVGLLFCSLTLVCTLSVGQLKELIWTDYRNLNLSSEGQNRGVGGQYTWLQSANIVPVGSIYTAAVG